MKLPQVLRGYLGEQFLLLDDIGLLSLAVYPSLPRCLTLPLNLATASIQPLRPLILTTTLLGHLPLDLEGMTTTTTTVVQVGVQPVLLG